MDRQSCDSEGYSVMKEIDWKTTHSGYRTIANLGNVRLHCYTLYTFTGKCRWHAIVRMGVNTIGSKRGPIRHSLMKAKEDAMRLAREMLLDFHASIAVEMRNFDLDVS